MKKFLTLLLSALCFLVCVCFVGCGRIGHNAVLLSDGITYSEEWCEQNYTYGGIYEFDKSGYDESLPKSRTYLIKNQTELDAVFSQSPSIDFEKEMVLVYCYTTIYCRKQVLENVVLSEGVLNVEFDIVKGKIGRADAAAPHTRMLAVKLDKLETKKVNVTYKGQ